MIRHLLNLAAWHLATPRERAIRDFSEGTTTHKDAGQSGDLSSPVPRSASRHGSIRSSDSSPGESLRRAA